jgi:hypothetical protein
VGLSARPLRPLGATAYESELLVDYPGGKQVPLYRANNPDALRCNCGYEPKAL